MKNLLFFILCALLLPFGGKAQQKICKVVFYNLENFFDTADDPDIRDEEFTPGGAKKWSEGRYAKKLANIERVFYDMAALDKSYPAVIGVSEIENRNVLEDIVAAKKLAPAGYRIVHHDSPDPRGIDVAFFYRPDMFTLEGERAVRAVVPGRPEFRTRDILTMWGRLDGEAFLFMVAHWPSRLGGKEASEELRLALGRQMRAIADSVTRLRPDTRVVMMGDLNDDPTDRSVAEGVGAKPKAKELQAGDFFAPYAEMLKAGYGTLAYGDAWNIFDNILVSANLVNAGKGQWRLLKAGGSKYYGHIFRRSYMVQQQGQFKGYPLRTYVGNNFQGGFSDHFPVYVNIGK